MARLWPSPAIIPRDLELAGATDKSHQRLQAQHKGHRRQRRDQGARAAVVPSGGHIHGQCGADPEHERHDGQGWLDRAVAGGFQQYQPTP
jgi:hypothetical protein